MTDSAATSGVTELYRALLAAWNNQAADAFAALFAEDAIVVGYDGSQMVGRVEVAKSLREIFASHRTASYVARIRSVRFPVPELAILHAVVGMVPPGKADINPDRNAIQILVARRRDGRWQIDNFQNTPAALDGRPEVSQALTEELRATLRDSQQP
jgi:uncharacterized protein (TIGR02246 family)